MTSTKRPDCSDTKTISINSERVATAEVDATKTAATTCDGTVTLYAKELPTTLSTISGYWTVQSNAQDVIGWTGKSSFVASVDKLAQDNNVFFWHLNGKCPTTSEGFTVKNNIVTPRIDKTTLYSCDGNVTLEAHNNLVENPGSVGKWTWKSGSTAITLTSDDSNYKVGATNIPAVGETFVWTLTKGTCSESAEVTVVNCDVPAVVEKTSYIAVRCYSKRHLDCFG